MEVKEIFSNIDIADVIQFSSMIIQVFNAHGQVIYVNDAWKNHLGYRGQTPPTLKVEDIIAEEDQGRFQECLSSVLKHKVSLFIPLQLNCRGQGQISTEGWLKPFEGDHETGAVLLLKETHEFSAQRQKKLMRIIEFSRKLCLDEGQSMDYQSLTEEMRVISGAEFAGFNLMNEEDEGFTTVAVAGDEQQISRYRNLPGGEIIGRKWAMDQRKSDFVKDRSITMFEGISDLAGHRISKDYLEVMAEDLNLGETHVVKIMRDNCCLGDFTLMMARDQVLESKDIIEIFTSQVALFIEKSRVMKKLHENAEKFEYAIDATGAATWEWDLVTDALVFSDKWADLLGYSRKEMTGHVDQWKRLWHPDEVNINQRALDNYLESQSENFELIHRQRHKDQSWKWFMTRGYVLRNQMGVAYQFVGIHVDVTDIHEAGLRKNRETEKLANILEATNAGTWEWNVQTGKNVYNARWAEIIGYTLEEISPITEETWKSFVHPEDLKKSDQEIESLFYRKKEYYSVECRMKHKDGSWVWVLDKGKVITWTEDGKPLTMFGTHIDITESKLLELEIKESEDKYRFLVESSYDIIYRMTSHGIFTYVSQAWETLLGHPVEEVIGRSFIPYVHPEDLNKIYAFFRNVKISGERMETTDYRLLHKDGSYHWFTTNAITIGDENGNPVGFAGTARDITEVKEATMALMEQKDELERFFTVNLDFLCIADDRGNFLKLNSAWERNLGYEMKDLVGRNALDLVHSDDVELTKSSIRRIASVEQEVSFTSRFQRSDGNYRILEWKAQLSNGLIYAAARDVTEKRTLEETLHIEKELFRTTLLSVGDGVIATDKHGRIIIMNLVAQTMTGWTLQEALGKPAEEVFTVSDEITGKELRNRVKDIMRKGKSTDFKEIILTSKTGLAVPIEDSSSPIRDSNGAITGVVCVFRDITEKREKQKRVEFLSYHDPLTGLFNRRYMEDAIKRMETTRNLPFTVMVMDVNGLKLTNDAFGHDLGDLLLKRASAVVRSICRKEDIVARVGGDEFVMLLPKTEPRDAERIKKRIMDETRKIDLGPVSVSLAIGFATKTNGTQNILEVQKVADNNMYRDKLKYGKVMKGAMVKTILNSISEKYPMEQEHLTKVADYCARIATAMGFHEGDVEKVRLAGSLHDIGKISVPKEILNKPGKLTYEEYEIIKRHAETSYQILKSVEEYSIIAEDVLYHHERMDGKGYPEGLVGNEIPLNSRIIAVADSYEAMMGNRSYQKTRTREEAISELMRCGGTQFDAEIVRIFVEHVLEG